MTKSDKRHDCSVLITRFEELVRAEEKMCLFPMSHPMGRKKIEELNSLRRELKKILSIACQNDFGYGVKED